MVGRPAHLHPPPTMSSFTQIREEKTVRKIRRVTKTITTREVQEVYEEEVEEPELAIVRVWSLRRISWRTRRARVKLTCWRPSPPIHVSSLQGAYIVPKEVSHLCIICFDACCFCICYGGVCQSAVSPGRAHLTSSPSPFLSCLPPGSRCGQKTKATCKHGHPTTLWAGGWSEIPPLLREAAGRRARGSTAVLPDVFADSIHARCDDVRGMAACCGTFLRELGSASPFSRTPPTTTTAYGIISATMVLERMLEGTGRVE